MEIRNQRHPYNAEYAQSHITGYSGEGDDQTVRLATGATRPRFANVEWEEDAFCAGTWAQPLWDDIKTLPAVTVNDPPFHQPAQFMSEQAADEAATARANFLPKWGFDHEPINGLDCLASVADDARRT